ncbi:unnamed protein product [Heligmosomoides polygyrus]|uniref:Uncharacterized protein n=1 Tax=Heligmosomoides polygyrus TaxID=6339 RepID=A0A183GJY0_HELPZ|nr:unnamed protein product [Heligmosomoides polygyrus]
MPVQSLWSHGGKSLNEETTMMSHPIALVLNREQQGSCASAERRRPARGGCDAPTMTKKMLSHLQKAYFWVVKGHR